MKLANMQNVGQASHDTTKERNIISNKGPYGKQANKTHQNISALQPRSQMKSFLSFVASHCLSRAWHVTFSKTNSVIGLWKLIHQYMNPMFRPLWVWLRDQFTDLCKRCLDLYKFTNLLQHHCRTCSMFVPIHNHPMNLFWDAKWRKNNSCLVISETKPLNIKPTTKPKTSQQPHRNFSQHTKCI